MMRPSLLIRSGLIAILFLAIGLPVVAAGPVPPGSFFRSPPAPTPVTFAPAEMTAAATPSPVTATATATPELSDSGQGATAFRVLFLPLVGSGVPGRNAAVSDADSPSSIHGDPHDSWAASFVYDVKAGDTIEDLAVEFGRDVSSMQCIVAEDGSPVSKLTPGQRIVVPALADLCHKVKSGETLASIAAWYGVDEDSLRESAQTRIGAEGKLSAGQYLLVPDSASAYRDPGEVGAIRQPRDNWRYGDGQFVWPVPRAKVWVSQGFRHGKHMAVDMATNADTPVVAADTGQVTKAGWSDIGYGYRIVIDHGNDYLTLYAHLSEYYVQPGDIVKKGDVIGAVGSTGNSTGPHLHFEIRDYGYLIDPLLVLP
ncbi:MAG: peptidoglycan DD-metalloendopeptidase family protein [Caldilineales bacterium]|nr:peptidoglycan DD-metalloendopeptidase family protein [Caldilineales bacterium]